MNTITENFQRQQKIIFGIACMISVNFEQTVWKTRN